MSTVEFHVLGEGAPDARLRYACRLADEAFGRGARVYLLTATDADARRLDDLLWTFDDRSFLPHEIYTGEAGEPDIVRVLLGPQPAPPTHRDLLINLTDSLPPDLESYARIAEIVDVDPARKQAARDRYREYRERGCVMESKNV